MYHGITFIVGSERYSTWENWRLIPVSRPIVAQPTPVYKNVEIPGKNGTLDLTDYLVNGPTYSDRKGQFEFYVYNDGVNWSVRRAQIANALNGRKTMVFLDDDNSQYYYYGRVFFKDWKSDAGTNHSIVTIEYQLRPHRYDLYNREAGL